MATLPNGSYRTKAGSTLQVSGKHGGIFTASFDWIEGDNACCDCHVDPVPAEWGNNEWRLTWDCEVCSGGSARLIPVAQCEVPA
jgi:hypothetical protein